MDAVFLDVGGVLLIPHPEPVSAALRAAGVVAQLPAEVAMRAHYVGVRALDEHADQAAGREAYLASYLDVLRLADEHDGRAQDALRAAWSLPAIDLWRLPVPGSLDGLRQLAAGGRKLAIISNSDGTVEAQLRQHRICQIGEGAGVPVLAILDSAVVGLSKPDPRIFQHAAQQLGLTPEQTVYVGDSRRYDVYGAAAAGVRAIHFDPFDVCAQPGGHDHVHSLAEVA